MKYAVRVAKQTECPDSWYGDYYSIDDIKKERNRWQKAYDKEKKLREQAEAKPKTTAKEIERIADKLDKMIVLHTIQVIKVSPLALTLKTRRDELRTLAKGLEAKE